MVAVVDLGDVVGDVVGDVAGDVVAGDVVAGDVVAAIPGDVPPVVNPKLEPMGELPKGLAKLT